MKARLAIGTTILALAAFAAPDLQPCVKEYDALGGKAFSVKSLPVFHQDQRQCEIAADETTADGAKSVWDGRDVSRPGIYIAVDGSDCGKRLVSGFSLNVPAKKQGYALKAKDGRVAIVGHDPVGALYGAVTLAQMAANGGMVEPAAVRDWPDILYRGSISSGRGLYLFAKGEGKEGRVAAMKAGFDMMLRNKFNMYGDHFRVNPESSASEKEFWREVSHYAAERGIWANVYGSTAVYQRGNAPKGVTLDSWPCVKLHAPWEDSYYCWSDDKLTEQAAERFAQFLVDIGAEMSVVNIHPVDGGSWQDPEMWSRRCAKCRARWNDHERWKASVNQFDIWSSVLRKRVPSAVVGSCIYPYTFNALLTPEEKRTDKWKESMPEYWQHLDESLADRDFYFSSWIATPGVIRELRKVIPRRVFHFSDTYPNTAGIFSTYHRKAATCFEPGVETILSTQGTDVYLHFESLLLMNEAMWDRNMPNADTFDGFTYYDAVNDHTGPKGIMTNNLRRICRTFWGRDLAPYMEKVLSSGVMPEYLKDPAGKVRYWNACRRDPLYDPMNPDNEAMLKNVKYAPIVDSIELMRSQVKAAQTCVDALKEAEPHAASLGRFKRKYFMKFVKYAPFWLATARARLCIREGNALVAEGRNAEAVKTLENGRKAALADYAFAMKNFKEHAKDIDVITSTNHPLDVPKEWSFGEAAALKLIGQAAASAQVVLKPRRIGRTIRVGVMKGLSSPCILPYLERFENVTAEEFDTFSLASLDRYDCVFLPDSSYDKGMYFDVVRAYVERGGGGVFLEGSLCGHRRFDTKTPFPEIVATAPEQVENFKRRMKFVDGREGETMYVDFFAMKPGSAGEVRAFGPDGKKALAVRGKAGLGKVFFSGTFNIGSLTGSDYATKECPLFGANAEFAREAIEYFTGIRLRERK